MRSKKLNCWKCQKPTGLPFCEHCHALQPVPESADSLSHFDVMGVPQALLVDGEKLREKFYELSKKLHPDKFAASSGPESMYALRWTTALNKAFQTLRDEKARSHYVLQLLNLDIKPKAVPTALAESYFELQDLLGEEGSKDRLLGFEKTLHTLMSQNQAEWNEIASRWEKEADKTAISKKLVENLNFRNYLTSMLNDLQKKVGAA